VQYFVAPEFDEVIKNLAKNKAFLEKAAMLIHKIIHAASRRQGCSSPELT
jgi:hypothetical protein